jgi:hypothetical protein
VAGSGGASAVTRGLNGRIPARNDNNAQNTCTLQEWHDLVRKTGFNVFASQGNQRAIMQMTTMAVINRKIDDLIINAAEHRHRDHRRRRHDPERVAVPERRVKLSNASVPWDSNITLLCQPSFLAYLEQATEFANAQYVDVKPYAGSDQNASWRDKPMAYRWRNCLIVEHPNLPGKGTSSEKSFCTTRPPWATRWTPPASQSPVGYDEEQDYSWARASAYMGALLLQNTGVVVPRPTAARTPDRAVWHYFTTDVSTAVLNAGYITDAGPLGMRPFDEVTILACATTNSTASVLRKTYVTSISTAGAASLSSGLTSTS